MCKESLNVFNQNCLNGIYRYTDIYRTNGTLTTDLDWIPHRLLIAKLKASGLGWMQSSVQLFTRRMLMISVHDKSGSKQKRMAFTV